MNTPETFNYANAPPHFFFISLNALPIRVKEIIGSPISLIWGGLTQRVWGNKEVCYGWLRVFFSPYNISEKKEHVWTMAYL